MNHPQTSALMPQLLSALNGLMPKDIKNVLANKARLSVMVKPLSKTSKSKKDSQATDFEDIVLKLERMDSRQEAAELIKDMNKTELLSLAKQVYISLSNSTPKDEIIDRIVERKVGLKLRQEAFARVMRST